MRYLLREISSAFDGRPSVFVPGRTVDDGHSAENSVAGRRPPLTLRPDVTFHFYCSHTPCGDASIFPKDRDDDDDDEAIGPDVAKRRKIDGDDIHRTGAKCLADETRQDPRLPGTAYHAIGAVRTKPGRGDRTLSVSCSDKLYRWHASGVQVRVNIIARAVVSLTLFVRLFCLPFEFVAKYVRNSLPRGYESPFRHILTRLFFRRRFACFRYERLNRRII